MKKFDIINNIKNKIFAYSLFLIKMRLNFKLIYFQQPYFYTTTFFILYHI